MTKQDNPQTDLRALGVSATQAREMVSLAKAAATGREAKTALWEVVDPLTASMDIDTKDRLEDHLTKVIDRAKRIIKRNEAESLLAEYLVLCEDCTGWGEYASADGEGVELCMACGGAGFMFDGLWLRRDQDEPRLSANERSNPAMRGDLRPYRKRLEYYLNRLSLTEGAWRGPWHFDDQDSRDGRDAILRRQGKRRGGKAPQRQTVEAGA